MLQSIGTRIGKTKALQYICGCGYSGNSDVIGDAAIEHTDQWGVFISVVNNKEDY